MMGGQKYFSCHEWLLLSFRHQNNKEKGGTKILPEGVQSKSGLLLKPFSNQKL